MRCSACNYANADADLVCGMCGVPLAAQREAQACAPPSALPPGPRFGVLSKPRTAPALGRRRRVFGTNNALVIGAFLVGALCMAGVVYALTSVDRLQDQITMGLLCGTIGMVSLVCGFAMSGQAVELYEHGFVKVDGRKRTSVGWDDVRGVYQSIVDHRTNGIPTGTSYTYTVECRDGTRLVFSGEIKGVARLGEDLLEEVKRRKLPEAIEAFERGESVSFGEVSVSPVYGVRCRTQAMVPWRELERMDIANGHLYFGKPSDNRLSVRVNLSMIPNLTTFSALVDHGIRRAVQQESG